MNTNEIQRERHQITITSETHREYVHHTHRTTDHRLEITVPEFSNYSPRNNNQHDSQGIQIQAFLVGLGIQLPAVQDFVLATIELEENKDTAEELQAAVQRRNKLRNYINALHNHIGEHDGISINTPDLKARRKELGI